MWYVIKRIFELGYSIAAYYEHYVASFVFSLLLMYFTACVFDMQFGRVGRQIRFNASILKNSQGNVVETT